MAEADSFKFNFRRAGGESKNVAVDVSTDGSGAEQPCFVDRRQEAMANAGNGLGTVLIVNGPICIRPLRSRLVRLWSALREAHEAAPGAGFVGWVVVGCDEGRGPPHFDSGFRDLAVKSASGREFRGFHLGDPAGRADAITTTDLFEGQSS